MLVIIHVLRDTVPVLIVPGRHGMAVIVLIPALITCRVRGGYQVPCPSIPLANVSSFTSESGMTSPSRGLMTTFTHDSSDAVSVISSVTVFTFSVFASVVSASPATGAIWDTGSSNPIT